MRTLRYAGFGPRATPPDQLDVMKNIGLVLAQSNWFLSSGWGMGADQAFAEGADKEGNDKQIAWLPWSTFNNAGDHPIFRTVVPTRDLISVARNHHKKYDELTQGRQKLLIRNAAILFGQNLDEVVKLGIYWQSEELENAYHGGTQHTRRIAKTYGIPIFNIRKPKDRDALESYLSKMEAGL